uniref:SMODS and SLOG-associating 2TM effector domain-containing protein n=1 Tax=Clytia hemisphaerica TaxID=252671 RepID=A0A7M5U4F8_9CNID
MASTPTQKFDDRRVFIKVTQERHLGHTAAATVYHRWSVALNVSLTVLSALATVLASQKMDVLNTYVVPTITGAATLLSAVVGYLKLGDLKASHAEYAKKFKILMFKMMEATSEAEEHEIWLEFYKECSEAPFLDSRYTANSDRLFSGMIDDIELPEEKNTPGGDENATEDSSKQDAAKNLVGESPKGGYGSMKNDGTAIEMTNDNAKANLIQS